MDQGSTMKRSAVHNFAPTVTKFCVMWEGQALPHDTKFGNSRCEIVGRRVIFIWSLILILDPWITLIRFDKSRAWWSHKENESITVMSLQCRVVSKHHEINCSFNSSIGRTGRTLLVHWDRNPPCWLDSPHKGPVKREMRPCQGVIMHSSKHKRPTIISSPMNCSVKIHAVLES